MVVEILYLLVYSFRFIDTYALSPLYRHRFLGNVTQYLAVEDGFHMDDVFSFFCCLLPEMDLCYLRVMLELKD